MGALKTCLNHPRGPCRSVTPHPKRVPEVNKLFLIQFHILVPLSKHIQNPVYSSLSCSCSSMLGFSSFSPLCGPACSWLDFAVIWPLLSSWEPEEKTGAGPDRCHLLGRSFCIIFLGGQVALALNGERWATFIWKANIFWDVHHPKAPDVPIPCAKVSVQVFSTSALTLA